MPQPDLFDIGPAQMPSGELELRCAGPECSIYLGGRLFMTFPSDRGTTWRHAAVMLYEGGHATQGVIAEAWDVTSRSLRNWVTWYRRDGISGLDDGRGRPLLITEEVKRQIAALREERLDINSIARRVGISPRTVYRALAPPANPAQPSLPFLEDVPEEGDGTEAPEACAEERDDEALNRLCDGDAAAGDDGSRPSSGGVANPLDRRTDRALARMGVLRDAEPVFAPCERADFAGSFLALALLGRDSFLGETQRVYRDIGAAFYGLRAVFSTLFLMAVLRIKTVEQVGRQNVLKLGRILGLDRCPSVRTLRRKIGLLCLRGQAMNLMMLLGKTRFENAGVPDAVLYIDGHVKCYYGPGRIGKTYSTSRNCVVAGSTDFWLNLGDGTPLLCIPTEFNDSMIARMPDILRQAAKLCGDRRITVVFDRGGSSAGCYERILAAGCDFVAYNRNPSAIDDELFGPEPAIINGKTYDRSPYERETELAVYARKPNGKYRKTKRTVAVREILVPRNGGGATSVATSRRDLPREQVAGIIFSRWTQENYFKYAVEEYNLDHLCVHGTEPVDPDIDHPNPEHRQLERTIKAIRKRIARIVGTDIDDMTDPELYQPQERFRNMHARQGKQLAELGEALRNARELIASLPRRVSAGEYQRLPAESRLLANVVKMTAYHVEGQLAEIVRAHWKGINGNERGMVAGFMQAAGSIEATDTLLKITIERQATPQMTDILARLCDDLTVCATTYPGTQLRMVFQVEK